MKTIKVELKGTSPILMNSPSSMIEDQTQTLKQKTSKGNMEKDAEKLAYRTKKGELYIPAEALKGCLIGAASYKKFGKFAAKPIIAGGVHIQPREVLLGTKKYELDIRTVVIQRARVVKARPMIDNWKCSFDLVYDESLIPHAEDIKLILEDAGKRVGLLDFRPQKTGSFGMFEISQWKEQ